MTVSTLADLACLDDAALPDLNCKPIVLPVSTSLAHMMGLRAYPCASVPYRHYSEWLERCPIVAGRAQLTNIQALKGKGLD